MEEFRKLISFDAIKPDRVLKMIDNDLSIDKIIGVGK
jgi:hypothetical protein